jgi:hypothetical protein
MADLVVGLSLLDSTGQALGVLASEFKNASAIVSGHAGGIGAPALIVALDQFCTDWKVRREQLLSAIGDVRELARAGSAQFRATDATLARQLRSGPGPGTP